MSEAQSTPRLWTEQGFQDDDWTYADDVDALASNRPVILPLGAFLALDAEGREAAAGRLGVHLQPGDRLEDIAPFLSGLPLVSLAFPAYNDGRSYSKAQLLRSRYAYSGIVRASGDVLIDQISLMLRTGFNEFEVTNATAIRRLEEGRIGGINHRYQPTESATESGGHGYSWRRLPTA